MASSLRDDLASLKIDRRGGDPRVSSARGVRRERGIGFLAILIWTIPLGIVAGGAVFAYKQYDQIRALPEVAVGLVQTMTAGEAEKLLSAKGYLKSRHQ